ncbi:hypothetical protein MMC24_001687 [Lignoscripta atroalba]|nr:hypothetical protein [Lignoscripta atroalba]
MGVSSPITIASDEEDSDLQIIPSGGCCRAKAIKNHVETSCHGELKDDDSSKCGNVDLNEQKAGAKAHGRHIVRSKSHEEISPHQHIKERAARYKTLPPPTLSFMECSDTLHPPSIKTSNSTFLPSLLTTMAIGTTSCTESMNTQSPKHASTNAGPGPEDMSSREDRGAPTVDKVSEVELSSILVKSPPLTAGSPRPTELTSCPATVSTMSGKRKAIEPIALLQKRQKVPVSDNLTLHPSPTRNHLLWSVPPYRGDEDPNISQPGSTPTPKVNLTTPSSINSANATFSRTPFPTQSVVLATPQCRATRKEPVSKPWTCKQYADLVQEIQKTFPFSDFAKRHSKTERDVFDVFSAVVAMPLLNHSVAGLTRARGGVGRQRVKVYKTMVKEANKAGKPEKIKGKQKIERGKESMVHSGTNPTAKQVESIMGPSKNAAATI